jgi:hypothetical protein
MNTLWTIHRGGSHCAGSVIDAGTVPHPLGGAARASPQTQTRNRCNEFLDHARVEASRRLESTSFVVSGGSLVSLAGQLR